MNDMSRKTAFKSAAAVIFTALFLAMTGCGSPDPFYIRVEFIEGVPKAGMAGEPLALTGTVRPVFASNNAIVWYIIDAGDTGASISGNILYAAAEGTVTIRAIIQNGIGGGKEFIQDFKIVINNGAAPQPIYDADLIITPPATNDRQDTVAGIRRPEDRGKYTADAVSWLPNDNPFKGTTVYTASVTLTANQGYSFQEGFTAVINGEDAVITNNTGTRVTVSYTFPETLDKEITGISIKTQPTKLRYIEGETIDLSGLEVTLVFEDFKSIDVPYKDFKEYNIVTDPLQGTLLAFQYNGKPVKVIAGLKSDTTNNLTVEKAVAKIGERGFTTLKAAIAAANGTAANPTEITIVANITADLNEEPAGFTIPANKHIKLVVESGKNFDIKASAGNYLFNVTAGSSLSLGTVGNLPLKGEVYVASGGIIYLSGNAQIDTLTLGADNYNYDNGIAYIASGWSAGNLEKLNLKGSGSGIPDVITMWKGKTVLRGSWLDASNVESINFKIWNFIDAYGNTQRMNKQLPNAPYGYAIGDSGLDMGKLVVASFNIYLEAQRYKEASADTIIIVPYDYVMPRPLIIPTPATTGITLTIKGDTPATKVTRGTQDATPTNGLFIVQSGIELVFENIVIDGNKSTHTGNAASLVRVNSGGTFTMNAGAVLQNNLATNGGGVYNNGTFTMNGGEINDNTGGGVYTSTGTFTMSGGEINGNIGRGVYVNGGTFNMSGGVINSNTNGGVSVTGGTFNMNSGKINGNTGIGVSVSSSYTFKMDGGEISKNTGVGVSSGGTTTINSGTISGNAGGVTVSGGTTTMNGGEIKDNTTAGSGGGVNITGGTFNIYGGEISGNKAAGNGGGVYNNGGTFRVGGTAKVKDNTKTDNTTSNAYITASAYITLGTGDNVPRSKMEIWAQTARDDGVVVPSGAMGADAYFKADEAGKEVYVLGGTLLICSVSDIPPQEVLDFYAQVEQFRTATANKTITVTQDLILPIPVNIPAPVTPGITLTINGVPATTTLIRKSKDTTAANGLFIVPNDARLVFEDIIIDGGNITGNAASLVRVNSGGTFTMNAGAVLQKNLATNGGGVYNNGTFTMNGGEINGNTGGGVYNNAGTFTMSGGEISGNTGRGVYVNGGTFTMSGGEINSNTNGGVSVTGGTFTMNSGKINGNTGIGVSVSSSYTFKMDGGEISKNTGVGVSSAGTTTINSGTISDNAGGVTVSGGTTTMNGGEIKDNTTAGSGGGVNITGGTFTMNSGVISGNTANGTGATNGGGGVYVGSGCTFNMYGGGISGNRAAGNGGGVYNNGTFRVGGVAKVSGNTKTNTSVRTRSNVYITGSTYITLGTGDNVPGSGMEIWVQTARADRVVVQRLATEAIKAYFKSDDVGKSVNYRSGQIIIGDLSDLPEPPPEVLDFYAQVEQYRTATADMTIIVTQDLTLPTPVEIPEPETSGITLTIKGVLATTRLIRGTEDTTADNGLFIVEDKIRLVFEDIIVDGGNITGNTASLVRVKSGGTFTMNTGAVLQNNRAASGGGVYNSGTFTMSGGEIKDNTATNGGGVYNNGGTFTMSGGKINNNTATTTTNGGGVYNNAGTFTMSGGEISGNTGRGVYVNGGTFTMSGGEINSNTNGGVSVTGGTFNMNSGKINGNTGIGVSVSSGYIFKMDGGEISNNTGVGVSSAGTTTINKGTISGNAGGVTVLGGTTTMNGGEIKGNTTTGSGGGVNNTGGTFTMNSGVISGNTASNGGGVSVNSGRTFNMNGGEIKGNTTAGSGGGVNINGGTFTMNSGVISGNKAAGNGGGVYNNGGTFMVGGTAKVIGNTKTDNTTRSNAYITASTYITLGTGANAPAPGMEIWVQTARPDNVIAQPVTNGTVIKDYFKADEPGKSVVFNVDALMIQ